MVSSRHLITLVAILMASLVIFLTVSSGPDPKALENLGKAYVFQETRLTNSLEFSQNTREVAPAMRTVEAWIASIGSSVALADLDSDGLENDLCLVDPRLDLVQIQSAASPPKYSPITLSMLSEAYYPEVMAPFGCLPGDMNEDGKVDLLVFYAGRPPLGFFQLENLVFQSAEIIQATTLEGWITTSAVWADVNGDRHSDLVVGCYFPDGTRLLDEHSTEGEEMPNSMSRAWNGGRNRILLSKKTDKMEFGVEFIEPALELEDNILRGWTTALASFDMNQDGLSEIYFANNFGPDQLLLNTSQSDQVELIPLYGKEGLTVPFSSRLGRDTFKAGGVEISDFNADSYPDILVSNIANWKVPEANLLFVHTGKNDTTHAPYSNRVRDYGLEIGGWGWDIRAADFNHDGSLEVIQANGFTNGTREGFTGLHELYWGNPHWMNDVRFWPLMDRDTELAGATPNKFFVNSNGRYFDVAPYVGLGQIQNSRGVVVGDLEGDGDLDLVIANQWEDSNIYHNNSARAGEFIGLRLLYPVSSQGETKILSGLVAATKAGGRTAWGAQAVVGIKGLGSRVGMVNTGNGHGGHGATDIHIGVGKLTPNDKIKVELRFRDGDLKFKSEAIELSPGWHTIVLGKI